MNWIYSVCRLVVALWRDIASLCRILKAPDPGPQRFVLVGLESKMRESLSQELKSQGHDVKFVEDFSEADGASGQFKPNYMLVDMSRMGCESALFFHESHSGCDQRGYLPNFIFLVEQGQPIEDRFIAGIVDQILLTHMVEEIAEIIASIVAKTANSGKPL